MAHLSFLMTNTQECVASTHFFELCWTWYTCLTECSDVDAVASQFTSYYRCLALVSVPLLSSVCMFHAARRSCFLLVFACPPLFRPQTGYPLKWPQLASRGWMELPMFRIRFLSTSPCGESSNDPKQAWFVVQVGYEHCCSTGSATNDRHTWTAYVLIHD